MSFRLIFFVLAVLAVFLYITFFNTDPATINLYPWGAVSLPISIPLMISFITGVVTVMLLYFYDALADTFGGMRKSSAERKAAKVAHHYEAGAEKLLVGSRREAEKFFRKALAAEGEHVPSLVALGTILREDGEISEAIKLHSKAKGLDEESLAAKLELAEDYATDEQFSNAVSVLQETINKAGRSVEPLLRIREIYRRVGNLKETIAVQKKIVSYSSSKTMGAEQKRLVAYMYEDADRLLKEGDLYEARDAFKTVLRKDDGFIPAYLKLADIFERTGDVKDAIKKLEKGFRVTRSLIVLKALEIFLRAKGEESRIIEDLNWAKGMMPENKAIRLFLAEAYIRNSNFPAARAEIEGLNGALDNVTLFHLLRGTTDHGENNVDQALEAFEEAYRSETATFFHFVCSACNKVAYEYSDKCKSCGEWNTLAASFS